MVFSRTTISDILRCPKRKSLATKTNYNSQFDSVSKTLLMGQTNIKDKLRKPKNLKTDLTKLKSMFTLKEMNLSK